MYLNPKIIRSSYIWKYFKDIFEENSLSISDIAIKMWTSQPNLSNALNGKKVFSDKFFTKLWNTIWLKDSEIRKVFKDADIEEFMFKHEWDIPWDKEMTLDEALLWIKQKAKLSQEQIIAIKAIMELHSSEESSEDKVKVIKAIMDM